MNLNLITFEDKVQVQERPEFNNNQKVNASDLNQIKNVINNQLFTTIRDLLYPVGIYLEISDSNFNPNNLIGGTWELEEDGTVLVSSSSEIDSIFNKTIGSVVGEEKHTMTIEELVEHNHIAEYQGNYGQADAFYGVATNSGAEGGNVRTKTTGGSQPFNVVQPSKIVYRWHRKA